jgi:Ser/Thr protein kinase RdoA (MazF antagonist)
MCATSCGMSSNTVTGGADHAPAPLSSGPDDGDADGARQHALPVTADPLRIVELTGPVGAGKTALRPHLEQALVAHGLVPLDPVAAVDLALGRSPAGRLLRPLLGRRGAAGLLRTVLVDLPFGIAAMAVPPRRGIAVLGAVLRSPIPWWHRRRILRLWLEAAGRSSYVRPRLKPGELLVFDEGAVHRAVNLFAWRSTIDEDAVGRYLELGPRPDLVVVVDSPSDVTRARLDDRGLPKRLRGRDPATVDAFLDGARLVVATGRRWLAASGVRIVDVVNDGHLDEAGAALARDIERLVVVPSTPPAMARGAAGELPAPAFRPRLPGLPRPRRTRRTPLASPLGLESATLTAVLAAYALAARDEPRTAPGGRGTSVVVTTDRGRVLVKRYKATVDTDALRGEHAVLAHLAEVGFPSPRLIADARGQTLLERRDGRYAAFEYVEGYRRADARMLAPADGMHLIRTSGATLAALHGALAGFVPPTVSPNGFRSPSAGRVRDQAWVRERIGLARTAAADLPPDHPGHEVESAADDVMLSLETLEAELGAADLGRVVVHGDYGPYNLLVRPGRPLVVVDFELARLDWRLTDLATALPRFARGRRGPSIDRAIAFATGYLERCAIRPSELERLPAVGAYLALRRAIACWARWAETNEDQWLVEAHEKMDLAQAYRTGRHPLALLPAAVRAS